MIVLYVYLVVSYLIGFGFFFGDSEDIRLGIIIMFLISPLSLLIFLGDHLRDKYGE